MNFIRKIIFIAIFSLIPCFISLSAFLPADQAFEFSARLIGQNTIQAEWNIAEGYHLYKSEISVEPALSDGTILDKIELPKGAHEHSEMLGDYYVYKNRLVLDIQILKWGASTTEIAFNYQGCKENSVCYPPMTKVISFSAPEGSSAISLSSPTLSSSQKLLQSGNIFLILAGFFVFGLFLSLTPCVLPMIPIIVGIIMGQKNVKTSKAFLLSAAYVMGVALTYTVAGVFTATLGSSIQALLQSFWVIILSSLIFVALAFSLFGFYELHLPSSLISKLTNASGKTQKGTYLGVFLMGVLSSLIVSPCVSAPLAGALIFIASTGNLYLGGSALFFLALGMGVLIIVAGVTGGKLFLKTGSWMLTIRNCLGVIMLGMAIWLGSRVIPDSLTNILWALLFMATGYFAGAIEPHSKDSSLIKIKKFISFLILLTGIFMAAALITQYAGFCKSQDYNTVQTENKSADSSLFTTVNTRNEFDKLLKKAKDENIPVMIDFYADWCVTCKEMDHSTFENPDVKFALKSFSLIRVDITKSTPDTDAIKSEYRVFAPPAIIFLDNKGNILKEASLAGFVSSKELLAQLNIIKSLYAEK